MSKDTTLGENIKGNLLGLVSLLRRVDEKQPNSRLNQYSMRNHYFRGSQGDDSALRTWFYHYKTLKKSGIIGGRDEAVERPAKR